MQKVWRRYDDMERRLSSPLSARMLDLAGLAPGMRVLDIATGRGEPAIPAAHRVAPTGSVLGVDVSGEMLQMARERADAEGVTNLELRIEDAQELDCVADAHYDAALARWCLMYFSSPQSALRAIRRKLITGGILVAAVWAEPERVPYYTLPRRLLTKYARLPDIDFEAPGVFHYAHADRIRDDFTASGLAVECIEEHEVPVMETGSGAYLIEWVRAFGFEPLVKELPPEIQAAWEADLVTEAKIASADGRISLGGVTRVVVARNAR